MSKLYVPKALREVWAMKEASYREVAHLPTRKALEEIMRRSRKTARGLGFYPTQSESVRVSARVAEGKAEYGTKRGKKK